MWIRENGERTYSCDQGHDPIRIKWLVEGAPDLHDPTVDYDLRPDIDELHARLGDATAKAVPVKSVASCRKYVQMSITGTPWVRPCGLWSCKECARTLAMDYLAQIYDHHHGRFFADWPVVYYRTAPSSEWKGKYAKQIERKGGGRLRVVTWAGVDHIFSSKDPVAAGWEPSLLLTPGDARLTLSELLVRRMVRKKPRAGGPSLWQFTEPKFEAAPRLGDVHRAFQKSVIDLYRQYAWDRWEIRVNDEGKAHGLWCEDQHGMLRECFKDAKVWIYLTHQAEAEAEAEEARLQAKEAEEAARHEEWAKEAKLWVPRRWEDSL